MKSKYLYLLLPLYWLACRPAVPPGIDMATKTLRYQTPGCQPERDPCLMIDLVFPVFTGDDSLAVEQAANEVYGLYFDILGQQGSQTAPDENGLMQAVATMAKTFDDYRHDFPDDNIGWQVNIETNELYRNDTLLTVAVNSFWFFGGAHGNYEVHYLNINRQSGHLLSPEELVPDLQALREQAEKIFRQKYLPAGTDSWEEAGFAFKGNAYQLPQNLAFAGDSIILHYNQDEIAPYAAGDFHFSVPIVRN